MTVVVVEHRYRRSVPLILLEFGRPMGANLPPHRYYYYFHWYAIHLAYYDYYCY